MRDEDGADGREDGVDGDEDGVDEDEDGVNGEPIEMRMESTEMRKGMETRNETEMIMMTSMRVIATLCKITIWSGWRLLV